LAANSVQALPKKPVSDGKAHNVLALVRVRFRVKRPLT